MPRASPREYEYRHRAVAHDLGSPRAEEHPSYLGSRRGSQCQDLAVNPVRIVERLIPSVSADHLQFDVVTHNALNVQLLQCVPGVFLPGGQDRVLGMQPDFRRIHRAAANGERDDPQLHIELPGHCDGPFDEAYVIPHTTLNVGPMSGGHATNIVADSCTFSWEIRHLPDQDPQVLIDRIRAYAAERLEPQMTAIAPETGFAINETNAYPGLDMNANDKAVSFLSQLTGQNSIGKVDFGTEGGFFQKSAGIPALVCGPGDIADAHKRDEFVALDQLKAADAFLAKLTERLAKPHPFP